MKDDIKNLLNAAKSQKNYIQTLNFPELEKSADEEQRILQKLDINKAVEKKEFQDYLNQRKENEELLKKTEKKIKKQLISLNTIKSPPLIRDSSIFIDKKG